MIEVRRYSGQNAAEWNQFVAQSKNGTFLFDRRYMDYHADRFADHSLMFYKKGHLYALLPAEERSGILTSHGGLTFGGLITDEHATTKDICLLFQEMNAHLQREGIRRVVYKRTPWIYCRMPAEEDLYALTQVCHASIVRRMVSSAILRERSLPLTESRRSGLRKAQAAGLVVEKSTDYKGFWEVLTENLLRTYHAKPVHSLEEIELLAGRFPENIGLYTATHEGKIWGGSVVYANPQVVRTQYISASPEGRKTGAVDLLLAHLIHEVSPETPFFDIGTSMMPDGNDINEQLIFQKEGFGGRAICYDTYEWEVGNVECEVNSE